MKKALLFVAGVFAAIALIAWVASWFRADEAVATSAAGSWPGGMGSLESVDGRVSAIKANAASAKLVALANALPKSDATGAFVGHEIARGELTIGHPPALPDVSAIRELLLREPIVWERHSGAGEIGDTETTARRSVQMTVARSLVASALAKGREHDRAAWDDLRAVWNLARSIDPQPQMMEQTAAFSMLRMINAVAWKMPLPAPAWTAEVEARDPMPRLLEAFQYQAASYWQDGARLFPTKWLASSIERDRGIAVALSSETRCDVTAPMNDLGVDLSSVWRRAFRYRAEREAAANARRIREGTAIVPESRCSDGAWTFDGKTLRFSREIATAPPDTPMPLELRVVP